MRFKISTTDASVYDFYLLGFNASVEEQVNRLGPTKLINTAYDWPRKTYDDRGWTDSVNSIWWPHGGDDFASCVLLLDDARNTLVNNSVNAQVASVATRYAVASATVVTGGTSYVTGDTVTLDTGTYITAAVFTVTAESGTVVSLAVTNGGSYSVTPTNPATPSTTTGVGHGLTINVTYVTDSVSPRPHLIISAMMSPKEMARVSEKYLPAGFSPADDEDDETELIAWKMYPLPPVPLTQADLGKGLWLLPLVDFRYFWRTSALLPLTGGSTTSQTDPWPVLSIDHTARPDWMPDVLGYPDDGSEPADFDEIIDNGTHPSIEGHANRGHAADKQADMEGWRIVCRDVRSNYNATAGDTQHSTFAQMVSDYPDAGDLDSFAYSAKVINGGTGYLVDDEVSIDGGTGTPAIFTVTQIATGGAVKSVVYDFIGDYTAVPDNPASVVGGNGTGLTLQVIYSEKSYHGDACRLGEYFTSTGSNNIAGSKCDAKAVKNLLPNKLAIFFRIGESQDYYQITIQKTIQDPLTVDDLSEDTTGLGTGERLYIPKVFLGVPSPSSEPSTTRNYTVTSATINAGGVSYTTGDTVTLSSGTYTTAAVFTVTATAGTVTSVAVTNPGSYSVTPSDPAVPATDAPSLGHGLILNVTYSHTDAERDALVTAAKQWAILYWRWRRKPAFYKMPGIAPLIPNGYAHMIRWDFSAFQYETTYIALDGIQGTDDEFGGSGSGTDTGFWAIITDKTYTTNQYTKYSWTRVIDSDSTPLAWADADSPEPTSGDAETNPAYEVNNIDLTVSESHGADSGTADSPMIVWLRKGQGDYYLIDMVARWEFVQATGDFDPYTGVAPASLLRYDQVAKDWVVVEDCEILDANAT